MIPFLINFFLFTLLFKLGSAATPSCSAVYVSLEEPSAKNPTVNFTYSGKENFDSLLKGFYSSFESDFGTEANSSGIQATFYDVHLDTTSWRTGGKHAISNKNGKHIWMKFTKTGEEGINSIRLKIKEAKSENAIDLYSQGTLLHHFTVEDLMSEIAPPFSKSPFKHSILWNVGWYKELYFTISVVGCTISDVLFTGGDKEFKFDDVEAGKWATLAGTEMMPNLNATITSTTTLVSPSMVTSAGCSEIYVTYEKPKVYTSLASFTYSGKENFESLTEPFYSSFVSNFGVEGNSGIQGTFYDVYIDQMYYFTGGKYAVSNRNGKHVWLNFTNTGPQGISLFGFLILNAKPKDTVDIYSHETLLYHFTVNDIWDHVEYSHLDYPYLINKLMSTVNVYVNILFNGCTVSAAHFTGGENSEIEFDNVKVGKWVNRSGTEAIAVVGGVTTKRTPPPATTRPATTKATPAATTPGEAAPAATTPGEAAPAITTPGAAAPAITTPGAAAPAITTPGAAAPAVTTPGAAAPAITTPGPAAPAVTKPGPAKPAVTKPRPAAPAVTTPGPAAPVKEAPAATTSRGDFPIATTTSEAATTPKAGSRAGIIAGTVTAGVVVVLLSVVGAVFYSRKFGKSSIHPSSGPFEGEQRDV